MYHAVVRAQVRRAFRLLSTGQADRLASQMRSDVHHTFPGDHALGGVRRDREAVQAWLHRLHRLFPNLRFEPVAMAASGPPWDTIVGVEWHNSGTLPDGSAYTNAGAHILRLRWGRLVSFHAYLDTADSESALRRLVELGVHEAGAAPISSRA